MTDARAVRVAARALVNPNPKTRAVRVDARALVNPNPSTRLARVAVRTLRPRNVDALTGVAVRLLTFMPPDTSLPDTGQPFQWHNPDPAAASGWVVHADRTDALVGYSIPLAGRADANAKTTPMAFTAQLDTRLLVDQLPQIGERFRLVVSGKPTVWGVTVPDSARVRFTGEVTDVDHDPAQHQVTVTAVGKLARNGRRLLDARAYPGELDGARVSRVLEAAGANLGTIDAGTSTLIPPAGERTAAATLLDQVVESTLGAVIEQRDGLVDYHDADHRRGAVPVLVLDSSEIVNSLQWSQHVGDVINQADVGYGTEGGSMRVVDPASVDAREPYPTSIGTLLPDASTAHSLGATVVGRRSEPVWQLPQLIVDVTRRDGLGNGLELTKLPSLLGLSFGDRLTIEGLPASSPYPAVTDVYLEGYAETATRRGGLAWRMALCVSDTTLSGVAVRIKDAPADLTIAGVDPTLTYLDCARIEDPDDLRGI